MNKTETKTKFNTVNSIADDFQILQRFQEFGSLNPTQKVREQLRKMLLSFRFKWFFSCSLESKQTKKKKSQIQSTDRKFQVDPHPNTSAANPNNFLPVPLSKHRSKALLYIWSHSCDARIRHEEGASCFQRCNCRERI